MDWNLLFGLFCAWLLIGIVSFLIDRKVREVFRTINVALYLIPLLLICLLAILTEFSWGDSTYHFLNAVLASFWPGIIVRWLA